jgi:hypothetical protein
VQCRAAHALARVGLKEMRMTMDQSGEAQEHNGKTRVMVELPKVDRFNFEKIETKNFKRGRIRSRECWRSR